MKNAGIKVVSCGANNPFAYDHTKKDLASWVSGARLNVDGGGERPYFLDLVKGD